jgi:hypothetical protein
MLLENKNAVTYGESGARSFVRDGVARLHRKKIPWTTWTSSDAPTISASFGANTKLTRALLVCGLVASSLYTVVGLIQMLVRDGFDIRRHALSLLSNRDPGWSQVANFLLAGLLVGGAVFATWASYWGLLVPDADEKQSSTMSKGVRRTGVYAPVLWQAATTRAVLLHDIIKEMDTLSRGGEP